MPKSPNSFVQNKKPVKKVVNGLKNVATVVKKAIENKKMGNNTGNKDQKCEKPTFSDIVKGNDQKEVKNKTFNSHPNRSIGQAIANEEEDNISLISITTISSSTTK